MKQKAFPIIFKGLLVARNCVQPESGPLKKQFHVFYFMK